MMADTSSANPLPQFAPTTDAEKLTRLRAMESEACEMANMAGLVWDLLEATFDGSQDAGVTGSRKDLHSLDPGKVERLHFAAAHSMELTGRFKDRFMKGLGYSST